MTEAERKTAEKDALQLLNGDYAEAVKFDEPNIEEVPTHLQDGEEDVATLHIVMGGDCLMASIPPQEGAPNWDYAMAIRRAGYHIWDLLQENADLRAAQGKDVAEQRLKLLTTLRALREKHRTALWHLLQGMSHRDPEGVIRSRLRVVDEVLRECGDGPS